MKKESRTAQPGPRPTMTDIATEAGVSQSTVSLVLNHMSGAKVAPETRERVLAVAAQLGYQLLRRKTMAPPAAPAADGAVRNVVVYLADEIATSPHPAQTMDGARTAAWEQNCLLSVFVTGGDVALEEACVRSALANPAVLGVVYASTFTRQIKLPAALSRWHGTGGRCVLLNCSGGGRDISSVVPGEVAGGFAATERLVGAGHRRIAFINGEPWMDAAQDRLKGYRQALATADIAFDAELVRDGDWMSGSGFDHALALLRQPRPPSAIFCANDLMALGVLEAAKKLGLSVPEQLSVMGYDDQEIARHAHPPLSTVLLPNYAMGHWAVERLLQEASAPQPGVARFIKMECPVVDRASVAPYRPA